MKYIYYGAGTYARAHFEELRKQHEPLCFCDRAARPGQTLFGLPVLPPSALTSTNADASILITRNPYFKDETQKYLIEEVGVSKERIADYEEFELVRTCYSIENELYFDMNSGWLCCFLGQRVKPPMVTFTEKDSPRDKVEALLELRRRIKTALTQGSPNECDGCISLGMHRISTTPKPLTKVIFSFNCSCNLRCSYCSQWHRKNELIDVWAYRTMINEMKKAGIIDQNTYMCWGYGEIAIHPQRAEILSVMSEYNLHIISNCTIYDEYVVKHLALGKAILNCSLDSGTRETYAKVKGADLFEQVCYNLKRYSEIAALELKYLFVPGVNDNEADVDGFISLIDDILHSGNHITVVLSRDCADKSPLSDQTLAMMALTTVAVETRCIPLAFFAPDTTFSATEREIYLRKVEELKTVDGFKIGEKK
ncbi:MAG: radical SAM protein [Holophagales bacterium]|jgi:pyruvate-formate lyase-activating enzyme|nr:radical SAM protein [Holophagales bacterium]